MIHPARRMPYHQLLDGLREAQAAKLVSERRMGDHSLWCYTQSCVFDRGWNAITTTARGLILDTKRECVVATPFPKFFNLGERSDPIPDLPFEVFEKLDGSLIIIWHDGAEWRTTTKGSLDSDQARAAARWLQDRDLSVLIPGHTYLAEYVAPSNRIVVSYKREELVLLGWYDQDGCEPLYPVLRALAEQLGWRLAQRHEFASLTDLVAHAGALPATAEGFVLRFTDGTRLKIKGDEYKRVHALISRCTPLAMWEAMAAGDNLDEIRRQLPEEFWVDFDQITAVLRRQVSMITGIVACEAERIKDLNDKELGLLIQSGAIVPEVAKFMFPYRKHGGDLLQGKTRQALFRSIRPSGNILLGYTPSYAMNRVMEEST